MQIVDYKIVIADSAESLQTQVQSLIAQGWQPVGPADLNVTRFRGQGALAPGMANFTQTMIKYGD